MNIQELINKGVKQLNECEIEDSGVKAQALLQHILNVNKQYLVINSKEEVSKECEEVYAKCIKQLLQGIPLQYITNKTEFMGLEFYVDENVLIPQPDTEVLVEETVKVVKKIVEEKSKSLAKSVTEGKEKEAMLEGIDLKSKHTIRILDMCTGSGAIAVSIAKYLQRLYASQVLQNVFCESESKSDVGFEIYASDISGQALKIAEKNAQDNGVQVSFIQSDMFEKIKDYVIEKFDIIVSNPPYIETETISQLTKEVQNEPHLALDGGKDGLDFYRRISENGYKYLKRNGVILLEIGYNQRKSVTSIFTKKSEYSGITCIKDLAKNDRIIKLQKM